MTLSAGTRLGPYEILSAVGAGGMGEVYRARDTRLERTVAVKVLPQHLSASPESRQRFEREAKTISQLSHPHICALYDVGRDGETEYLVMEYLEGETLSDRIAKGPVALDQTLKFGVEIADALDKAHRQGIVHRDLKPGNVMLTKSGVKLLDFGLAKAIAVTPPTALTSLPTAIGGANLTQEGTILGTFPYMSPEQLEGKEADARSDIFALGCVLYEMATSRKAFSGTSQATVISSILTAEPPPISSIEPTAPPALDRVVKTCLAKDPEDRWQSARDLMTELHWASAASSSGAAAPRRRGRERLVWILATVALLFVVLAQAMRSRGTVPERSILRMSVLPPEGMTIESISISPDGKRLAFAGSSFDGRLLLWVRSLDEYECRPLRGTDGATYPFWSPDGQFIGFFAEGKLKKVAAAGGPVEALADAPSPRGGTWGRDRVILFSPSVGSGVFRVSASGGAAAPVIAPDVSRGEYSDRWPFFLPDGRRFLYYSQSGRTESRGVSGASLDSKERHPLLSVGANPAYSPPGYLLFDRDGTLLAAPFDERRLRLTGDPTPLAEDAAYDGGAFRTDFAVSANGTLAFRTGGSLFTEFLWVDRSGKPLGTVGPPASAFNIELSSDDRKLLTSRLSSQRGSRDIWVYDVTSGVSSRLTFGPGSAFNSVWSGDGKRVAFNSLRGGAAEIDTKSATGTGQQEVLLSPDQVDSPLIQVTDWSLDNRYIAFTRTDPKTRLDVWVLPTEGAPKPFAFAHTDFDELEGRFSPDARWIAYSSNESGRFEVYVQSFPASGGKWQISNRGGVVPRWRRDGKELFYIGLDQKMMAVGINTDSGFQSGVPRELFEAHGLDAFNYSSPYTVTADGQRFLMLVRSRQARASAISVILGWTSGLPR